MSTTRRTRWLRSLRLRMETLGQQAEAGMATAEYAIATLVACAKHTSNPSQGGGPPDSGE